jgi:thiol:disulfide interchange protein DsbD
MSSAPKANHFSSPAESAEKFRAGWSVFGQKENESGRNAWSLNAATTPAAPALPRGFITYLLWFHRRLHLNLMPCVLPVISLKIFGFISTRARIGGAFCEAACFRRGIFAWFVGLALLLIALKSAGREITWAFQFTNPYFVVLMSAVVLVFALNLFGVFEISLPQFANRGVLGWTAREGDAGSFFQGVFATVLATPCTAPFLGTALGFAFTQSGWTILLMFLAIAAGMAFPYFLCGATSLLSCCPNLTVDVRAQLMVFSSWLHCFPPRRPRAERG